MMILWILSIFAVCALMGLIGLVLSSEENDYRIIVVISALIIAAILVYIGETIYSTPEAMDVYQGKTTLKYTIVDGEKVDSVVVWKQ